MAPEESQTFSLVINKSLDGSLVLVGLTASAGAAVFAACTSPTAAAAPAPPAPNCL